MLLCVKKERKKKHQIRLKNTQQIITCRCCHDEWQNIGFRFQPQWTHSLPHTLAQCTLNLYINWKHAFWNATHVIQFKITTPAQSIWMCRQWWQFKLHSMWDHFGLTVSHGRVAEVDFQENFYDEISPLPWCQVPWPKIQFNFDTLYSDLKSWFCAMHTTAKSTPKLNYFVSKCQDFVS